MSDDKNALSQMHEMLYGKGESSDYGCGEEKINEMLIKAQKIDPYKKIRVIKEWQWWDLQFYDNEMANEILKRENFEPSIIYSHYLISDSSGEFRQGYNVKTTILKKFHKDTNCIFETKNTFYIMVGNGVRKKVDAILATSIYF